MKYIDLPEFGGPSVMKVASGPTPEIQPNDVLIEVKAAGINRPDIIQRQGHYPAPPGASPVLGLEVAGKVIAIGEQVTRWKVGDDVCALTNGGGYAEHVAVIETQCLAVPKNLSYIEAASLPETHFTVWSNIFERARLLPNEILLVHGGSSGIGTTAIQLAKAFDSMVFATVGNEEKRQACKNLGADRVINYNEEDFVDVIKTETQKRGANVILDMVGGDYIAKNIKAAATDGRIVNIAYLKGSVAEVNFMPVMLKRLTLTGSTLRPQSNEQKAYLCKQLLEKVWPLYENKTIKPVIAEIFEFEDVVKAHELMESNRHIGKIVLML